MFSKNKKKEYPIIKQVKDMNKISNSLAVFAQLENPVYRSENINETDELNRIVYKAKPNITNFYIFNEINLLSNNSHYFDNSKVLDINNFKNNKDVKFASNKILIDLSQPVYANDKIEKLAQKENYIVYGLPMYQYYPEYGEVFNMTILFFSSENNMTYVDTAFHFVFKKKYEIGSFYGNPYFLKSLFEVIKIGKSTDDAVDIFNELSLFDEPVIF